MVTKNSAPDPRTASEGDLEQRAKTLFDESVERLDARTRSRLNRARNAALDELKKSSSPWPWLRAPAAGLAIATVIAVFMWPRGAQTPESASVPLDDFDIVGDAENLEMLQDVDFYVWLDDQPPGDLTKQSG